MVRAGGEELRPYLIAEERGREGVSGRSRAAGGREAVKERLRGEAREEVEGAGRRGMAVEEGGTDGGRPYPGSFSATGHGRSGGRRTIGRKVGVDACCMTHTRASGA